MPNPSESAERREYLLRLAAIREDPQIRHLARKRAGDPELAEDALQEAFYALATFDKPGTIDDLRKYFSRVLINTVYRLSRSSLVPVEDIETAPISGYAGNYAGQSPPGLFDGKICTQLAARDYLRQLTANRSTYARTVSGRSGNRCRYRHLVVACAKSMLAAVAIGEISDADSNSALSAAYPEWFAEEGCEDANLHQRFKRFRDDLRTLLHPMISQTDLYR